MRVDWVMALPTRVFLVLPLTASTRMGERNPTPDQRQQLAHVDRLYQQDGFARGVDRQETPSQHALPAWSDAIPKGRELGARKWVSRTREGRTIGLVPLSSGRVRSDSLGGTRGASTLRGRRRL